MQDSLPQYPGFIVSQLGGKRGHKEQQRSLLEYQTRRIKESSLYREGTFASGGPAIGEGPSFTRFWPSPHPHGLSLLRSYPYWLDSSRACPFLMGLTPSCERWSVATPRSFLKCLRETRRGVAGVCYILKRSLTPEGVCCGQTLPALFQSVFFPPGDLRS